MNIAALAIKRPVLTTMILSALILFGAISFTRVGIDLFPRVEFPIITVISILPGADPETIETKVTDIVEEAVATISGIKHLRSTSADNVSQVVVEFELDKDFNEAYQEVQAKIGTIRGDLPADVEEPVIEKLDIDASPILSIVLSAEKPVQEITRTADKIVKQRIQRIKNVGQVKLVGDRERKIWIWLDGAKLVGHYLSVQDVINALRTEHIEVPGGRVETGPRELIVKTKAEFTSAEQIENMIVAYRNDAAIRIRDIGRAEDGLEEQRSFAALDGVRAVALLVRRQSGTNTVEVAHAVKAEIERLRKDLESEGYRLAIAQDQSVFIEHSVDEVRFHLVFGGLLAVAIVFFFLRNVRSTFISALVIPASLIGTFTVMNALDFTQNMMTLLALSLAIGLLIDDAIVVQENIMRHVEEGKPPRQAALDATREIMLAVVATTLSVVAVFVPVAFMEGQVGRFFYQFGITVASAVLLSMFISFTLDPMLSSRILRKPRPGGLYHLSEKFFLGIEWGYERILAVSLRLRWLVVLIALGTFAASGYLAQFLRSEFIPLEDQSEFNIRVKAPLGASLTSTKDILDRIRGSLGGQPWLDYTFMTIGSDELRKVNEGQIYVKMKDKQERAISQNDAMLWARGQIAAIREAIVSVEIVPRFSGGGRKWADIQLEVRGSDLARLEELSRAVVAKMRDTKGYTDIDTTYETGKPELNLYIKRDEAADLGISPISVASTVRALVGGEDVAQFRAEGDRYDISIRLMEAYRNRPEQLPYLTVRNREGELIRIKSIADIKDEGGPVQIDRYNRARQVTVLANLEREHKVLGEAVSELTQVMEASGIPSGYTYGFAGMAESMQEAFFNLIFAILLSVAIVYMVLAGQFESFIHPLTIMMALPLSIIGAIGALLLFGMTVNIYTMIGVIMLIGLVTKNGILLVDYINKLRERDGMDRRAAILKAGPVRLRPILMTTFALIFGMLPIAMGTGAGAESRAPMATAVIGGLITSTLLTLIVVPAIYTIMDDLSRPSQWRVFRWLRKPDSHTQGAPSSDHE